MNIDDGSLCAGEKPGSPPDEFLPQGARSSSVRIDLGRKGTLEGKGIEGIPEEAGKTRNGNENLHRIGLTCFQTRQRAVGSFLLEDLHSVHLSGKSPTDIPFDGQPDFSPFCWNDTTDLQHEFVSRIVSPDAKGADGFLLMKEFFEPLDGLD